jgi:hypothetical protein
MESLTRSVTIQLTEADLSTILTIVKGFERFDSYYERLCYLQASLVLKEYRTLSIDIICFYEESVIDKYRVNLFCFVSLIQSMRLLYERYSIVFPEIDNLFKQFLSSSIKNSTLIIQQVTTPKDTF